MVAFFFCGPDEINEQIKKTENKLTVLREELKLHEKELVTLHEQLNFYENKWPTLEESKPGDTLKDGCIVVNKFSDTRIALIAAPSDTEIYCQWSKDFNDIFNLLEQKGFNRLDWFIPNVEQLEMAFNNCYLKGFRLVNYWSRAWNGEGGCLVFSFPIGSVAFSCIEGRNYVRAFSLVSY